MTDIRNRRWIAILALGAAACSGQTGAQATPTTRHPIPVVIKVGRVMGSLTIDGRQCVNGYVMPKPPSVAAEMSLVQLPHGHAC
jgi:hypothetical protein